MRKSKIKNQKSKMYFGFCAVVLISVFCILNFMGCARLFPRDPGTAQTGLEPSVMQKFMDLPVPSGFKLLHKESYAFESGNVRVGVLTYAGRPTAEKVVEFYQAQMPMYNWNLINIVEYSRRILNFERENETCIINIEPRWNKTKVTISLGPKQQIPKRQDKPVK